MPIHHVTKTNTIRDVKVGDYFKFTDEGCYSNWQIMCSDRFVGLYNGFMVPFASTPAEALGSRHIEILRPGDKLEIVVGKSELDDDTEFMDGVARIRQYVFSCLKDHPERFSKMAIEELKEALEDTERDNFKHHEV